MSDYWFAHLPAGLQDSLLEAACMRRKTPGKLLFEKGSPACGLYVLMEGEVRMGRADEQRLSPRVEQVRAPYWFGENALFDAMPRRLDAYSMNQTIFLHIPQAVLVALLEKRPQYWPHFAELFSQKLGLPVQHPERINVLPAKARVAWGLLLLAEGYGHLSHARRLITLDEIQSMRAVGLSRQALLDVLQDLHQRKILRLGEQGLEIFDVDKLRKATSHSRAKSLC
jgi:CRP-like cAMP-binding protein